MKPHITIDLRDENLDWEYMGFGLNRKFHPCLKITQQFKDHKRIVVFEGYNIIWNLLDTVCYEQPLPRSHFNDVLKHRWDSGDSALEIIQDVLRGGDVRHIIVQGDQDAELFIVRIIHKPWGGLKMPVLNEITDIMLTSDCVPFANAVFWEPYTAILRHKLNTRTLNLASVVGVWRIEGGALCIRCMMVEQTQSFIFIPTIETEENVYPHPSPIKGCSTTAPIEEIYAIFKDFYLLAQMTIPKITEKTPTFSDAHQYTEPTITKYKRNARIMMDFLALHGVESFNSF